MKYRGMARFMWPIYRRSFSSALVNVLGYNGMSADRIMRSAEGKYRSILGKLPEFEKDDIFKTNILSCSMLIAVLQSLDKRPAPKDAVEYYKQAMTNMATKAFCRRGAKQKFTDRDIKKMKKTAALHAADRNPYSWNMDYIPYKDGSGYEARFYKCGICTLMKEYGYFDLTPAMCALDYTMSDMGGATVFVRENTLASGGPYCDCGYKKKDKSKNIWDRFAPVYRGFVTGTPGNRKAYETMYRKIRAVVKDKEVLELATGPGMIAKQVASDARKIIATDFSEKMIDVARKGNVPTNVIFERADATDLSYDDNSFDVVVIANALHVIPRPERVLDEIKRVLRPGGLLIAPNFIHDNSKKISEICSRALSMAGISFEAKWNADGYLSFLSGNGFEVTHSARLPSTIPLLYTECKEKLQ